MPKPIEDIKEDLSALVIEINALRMNFKELQEINKDMKEKIELLLGKRCTETPKKKTKGWIYGEY